MGNHRGVKGEGPPSPEMGAAKPLRGGSPSPEMERSGATGGGSGAGPSPPPPTRNGPVFTVTGRVLIRPMRTTRCTANLLRRQRAPHTKARAKISLVVLACCCTRSKRQISVLMAFARTRRSRLPRRQRQSSRPSRQTSEWSSSGKPSARAKRVRRPDRTGHRNRPSPTRCVRQLPKPWR